VPKLRLLPDDIQEFYEVYEWRNASAVLHGAHPNELNEILSVLRGFRLMHADVLKPGGSKSDVAGKIDQAFYALNWYEKRFDTSIRVDEEVHDAPTHGVDCYKNGVALEVEWNNKDPFFDRDLNNFRLLFELRAIDAGVIITRCDELQTIFKRLGRGHSYGASTTHMSKLLPRLEGGAGGGCPVLTFGISAKLYVEAS
jgi:hypothetical protein